MREPKPRLKHMDAAVAAAFLSEAARAKLRAAGAWRRGTDRPSLVT